MKVEKETLAEGALALHPKARAIRYVVLSISDCGSGIPQEVMDRMFDPFYTTKAVGHGTGLGLSTVLGIVEGHGGFILVESTVGKGTTFRAYLPALEGSESVSTGAGPSAVPKGKGELILVVDDESAILQVARDVLSRGGYAVLTATNSSEALGLVEKHRGELKAVITDIMMPFGDGRALIAVLRAQLPKLTVIAMSGLSSEEFQAETLARGANGFLRKPFVAADMLETLGRLLAG